MPSGGDENQGIYFMWPYISFRYITLMLFQYSIRFFISLGAKL
jgi:hypothetical protein